MCVYLSFVCIFFSIFLVSFLSIIIISCGWKSARVWHVDGDGGIFRAMQNPMLLVLSHIRIFGPRICFSLHTYNLPLSRCPCLSSAVAYLSLCLILPWRQHSGCALAALFPVAGNFFLVLCRVSRFKKLWRIYYSSGFFFILCYVLVYVSHFEDLQRGSIGPPFLLLFPPFRQRDHTKTKIK